MGFGTTTFVAIQLRNHRQNKYRKKTESNTYDPLAQINSPPGTICFKHEDTNNDIVTVHDTSELPPAPTPAELLRLLSEADIMSPNIDLTNIYGRLNYKDMSNNAKAQRPIFSVANNAHNLATFEFPPVQTNVP